MNIVCFGSCTFHGNFSSVFTAKHGPAPGEKTCQKWKDPIESRQTFPEFLAQVFVFFSSTLYPPGNIWKLTCPIKRVLLKMMFLFPKWVMSCWPYCCPPTQLCTHQHQTFRPQVFLQRSHVWKKKMEIQLCGKFSMLGQHLLQFSQPGILCDHSLEGKPQCSS